MKINWHFKFSGTEIKLIGKRIRGWGQRVPLLVFVRFGAALNFATVLVVATVAGVLFWQLLYREPVVEMSLPTEQPQLSTDAIDRLEFWIEAREDERKNILKLPERDYFKGQER